MYGVARHPSSPFPPPIAVQLKTLREAKVDAGSPPETKGLNCTIYAIATYHKDNKIAQPMLPFGSIATENHYRLVSTWLRGPHPGIYLNWFCELFMEFRHKKGQ